MAIVDMRLDEVDLGLGEGGNLGHLFSEKVGSRIEVLGFHFIIS